MSFHPDSDLSGTIARLFVYPVKSCAGIEVQQALLTDTGLDLDRAWMVVDAEGMFVTQRTLPRMALIRPQLKGDEMVLRAPGMLALHVAIDAVEALAKVTVWRDTVPAWDMGAVAAQWFTDFLGQPCRLVRFDPEYRRLSSMEWTGGVEAPNQFSDGFPLLLASQASMDELNVRLQAAGHAAAGIEQALGKLSANHRAVLVTRRSGGGLQTSLVLAGVDAHDEDRVDLVRVDAQEGEIHLQPVKPCSRCPIPDIDPATAESNPSVGDTLRTYRKDQRLDGAITFGMNAIVRQGAGQMLRVGQRVAANLRFD